jgi:VWFA-related protein
MKRSAFAFLLTLGWLSSATAQVPSAETFKAGVTTILVPVVVRDRDGHAVSNLGKDAFQLFDNGKRQEITSFSVDYPGSQRAPDRSLPDATSPARTAGAARGIEIPERFVTYFFDDVAIQDFGDLTRLREAASRQLGTLQPGDRVAIVTSSCRLTVDFTNDPQKLQAAISHLQLKPAPVCRVSRTQKLQVELLKAVVGQMSKLPAYREIIVVSPGFFVGHDRSNEQMELIETAVRANVVINAVDVGESTISGDSGDAITGRASQRTQTAYRNPSIPLVLVELARGTGGTYVTGSDFALSFRKLATPESHYVLGFVPDAKADGRFHQLKVKLQDARNLSVKTRDGYYAPPRPD